MFVRFQKVQNRKYSDEICLYSLTNDRNDTANIHQKCNKCNYQLVVQRFLRQQSISSNQ